MSLLKKCKELRKGNAAVATTKEELEKRTDELKKATVRLYRQFLFMFYSLTSDTAAGAPS